MADEPGKSATDDNGKTDEPGKEATTTAAPDDEILKGAENPDAVRNALQRERDAAKEAKKRADDLAAKVQEFEDRDKSDQQKLEERATEAEKKAADADVKLLRYEVAAAKGVPLKQAHRLQGSTKEELEADAEEFLKDVKANGGGAGGQLDGGARGSGQPTTDMDTLIRRSAGRA